MTSSSSKYAQFTIRETRMKKKEEVSPRLRSIKLYQTKQIFTIPNSNLSAPATSHKRNDKISSAHTYTVDSVRMPFYLKQSLSHFTHGDKNTRRKCVNVSVSSYRLCSWSECVADGSVCGTRELMWNQSQQDLCYAFTFGFTIFLCLRRSHQFSVPGRLSSPSRIEGSGNWSSLRFSRSLAFDSPSHTFAACVR